jgi:hypothetical protein
MSRQITDTTGNAITVLSMSLAQNSESPVLVIEIPATAGMSLTAGSDPAAQVLARRTGSGDAFVDIAAAPILLTPFAGTVVQFDVKLHAAAFSGLIKRVALPVRVKYL